MKYNSFFKLLTFAFVCAFLATSCVKEGAPGVDGQPGTNGQNGAPGADGADGTAFCLNCHNDNTMGAIETEWKASVHGSSAVQHDGSFTYEYAGLGDSRKACAVCHTQEGFIERIATGKLAVENGLTTVHAIGCESCHNGLHITFDVENDGEDFALRTTQAVNVIIDPGQTINLNSKESNLCVNCHQAREGYPEADTLGNFEITSTHWGAHHGPQGNLIVGELGYKFLESTDYPEIGNTSTEHAKAGCVACHMSEATDHPSHTFMPMVGACTECHGEVTDFDIDGVQTEVSGLLVQLEALLEETGVMANGGLVAGTYPVKIARAYYNYIICEEDRSLGVHNPDYIKALLSNTIEALQ